MHAVFEKVEKYVKRCYNKIEANVLSCDGIIISSLLDEQDFFPNYLRLYLIWYVSHYYCQLE